METKRKSGPETACSLRHCQYDHLNAGTVATCLHKSLHTPENWPTFIGLTLHKCTYKSEAVNVSQLFLPLLLLVTFLSACVLNKHTEGKTIHGRCQGIGEIYHKQFWNDCPFSLSLKRVYVCVHNLGQSFCNNNNY
jgi:hypothetical protein